MGAGQAASAVRPGAAAVSATAEQLEIRHLRRELERAQMERDILKNELGPAARLWRQKREAAWLVRGGAAVGFLVDLTPLKNVAHGLLRTCVW